MRAIQDDVTDRHPGQTPERRSATRYAVEQDVRYRVIGSGAQEIRTAKTVNISTNGILFSADAVPALGRRLTLKVRWPRQSDQQPEFDLVIRGRVVRATETSVALAYETFELRAPDSAPLSATDLRKILMPLG